MKIYRRCAQAGRSITQFGSCGVVLHPFALLQGSAHIVQFVVEPNGVIGQHPAQATQLLMVISGGATVFGAERTGISIQSGDVALWQAGEEHETRAGNNGLYALVIEAEQLTMEA